MKQPNEITDNNFKRKQCSLFQGTLIYKNIVFPMGQKNNFVILIQSE